MQFILVALVAASIFTIGFRYATKYWSAREQHIENIHTKENERRTDRVQTKANTIDKSSEQEETHNDTITRQLRTPPPPPPKGAYVPNGTIRDSNWMRNLERIK
jgi:hypothetical protein